MKFFASAVVLAAAVSAAPPKAHQLEGYTFGQYVQDFGKQYSALEYQVRRELFETALAGVMKHNADPSQTYKQGVNRFTDFAQSEFTAFKGSKREGGKVYGNEVPHTAHSQLLSAKSEAYAPSIDWRLSGVTTPVKDQGGCGSCWAFSATEVLETATAIATGKLIGMSPQEFVSCMPNPDSCGGTGGCSGSVQWLAFGYASEYGMTTEASYPYRGVTGTCQQSKIQPVANVTGYVRLPTNDYDSLMAAMQFGSVAISVSASWGNYESGVFTNVKECGFVIDHAVVAEGYGTDAATGLDYWLVRNSWGPSWGEDGYIRLLRNGEETVGTDSNPADGSACKPYPASVEVKGICGVLSDSSYPTGAHLL